MLCPDCNTYAAEDDIVCPRCGKLLNRQASEEEELMSFRQGRHLRRAESQLPPPPAEPGSTGASRSFEDVQPRQSAHGGHENGNHGGLEHAGSAAANHDDLHANTSFPHHYTSGINHPSTPYNIPR